VYKPQENRKNSVTEKCYGGGKQFLETAFAVFVSLQAATPFKVKEPKP
jgi:hypothetical protein